MKKSKLKVFLYSTALLTTVSLAAFGQNGSHKTDAKAQQTVALTAIKDEAAPVTTTTLDQATADVPLDAEHFPDAAFRSYLKDLLFKYDNDTDGKTLTKAFLTDTQILTIGPAIKDVTGITNFPNVDSLYMQGTTLTDLSFISQLPKIIYLNLQDAANITKIDGSSFKAPNLTDLSLGGENSPLETVNLQGNFPALDRFAIQQGSTVSSVTVEHEKALRELAIDDQVNLTNVTANDLPGLKSLELTGDSKLDHVNTTGLDINSLWISKTSFNSVDPTQFPKIATLSDNNCKFTSFDPGQFPNLSIFNMNGNQLKTLDFSKTPELNTVNVDNNQLTSMNFDGCTVLSIVSAKNNQLTSLDVTAAAGDTTQVATPDGGTMSDKYGLTTLTLSGNQLTSFDSSPFKVLRQLDLSDNQLTSFKANENLVALYLTNNNLSGTLDLSGADNMLMFNANGNHLTYIMNKIPAFPESAGIIWTYYGEETVDATTYQQDGKWFVNLQGLIGKDNDINYVQVVGTKWKMRSDGTAQYLGAGQPTSIDYIGFVPHLDTLLASDFAFVNDYHVTANLVADGQASFNVSFDSFDDEQGTVSGSISVKQGETIDPSQVPTPKPADGYEFDHWIDADNNVIDFATYSPIADTTLYAIFKPAEKTTTTDPTTDDDSTGASATDSDAEERAEAAKDAETAASNGLPADDISDKSQVYQDAYTAAYNKDHALYVEGFESGKADGIGSYEIAYTNEEPLSYRYGYSDGYSAGMNLVGDNDYDDAALGQLSGTIDAQTRHDPADNTGLPQAYQDAYTAAYDATVDQSDDDYMAGANAADADVKAGKSMPDISAESIAYQMGYTDTFVDPAIPATVDDDATAETTADAAAGKAAGEADGAAGADPAANDDQSEAYQDAYNAAYQAALSQYDSDFADGQLAGQNDALAGKAADQSDHSQGYEDGYQAGYKAGAEQAKTAADDAAAKEAAAKDAKAGSAAAFKDGAAGKAAADTSKESAAYQEAYAQSYELAKKAYDFAQDVFAKAKAGADQAKENAAKTSETDEGNETETPATGDDDTTTPATGDDDTTTDPATGDDDTTDTPATGDDATETPATDAKTDADATSADADTDSDADADTPASTSTSTTTTTTSTTTTSGDTTKGDTAKADLPQTGEQRAQGLVAAGLAVIAAIAGFFGLDRFYKRQH